MRNNFNKGFTLVELLAVVTILATIATATVIIMNPVEMIRQAEDAVKLNDLNSIHQVLNLFRSNRPGGSLGVPNTVYVSIPSASTDCAGLGLPPLPAGWNYRCATTANLRNINGTGWIPVNFTAIRGGSPISVLPVDPINNANFFYAYLPSAHHRYTFSARIESIRQRAQNLSGIFITRFAAPFNFNMSLSPASGTVTRGGNINTTVIATLVSGTAREVSFSVSGLPVGTTASFSPTSDNPPFSSNLNIVTSAATPTTPTGTSHSITVIGTGRGITRTAIYALTVN